MNDLNDGIINYWFLFYGFFQSIIAMIFRKIILCHFM